MRNEEGTGERNSPSTAVLATVAKLVFRQNVF